MKRRSLIRGILLAWLTAYQKWIAASGLWLSKVSQEEREWIYAILIWYSISYFRHTPSLTKSSHMRWRSTPCSVNSSKVNSSTPTSTHPPSQSPLDIAIHLTEPTWNRRELANHCPTKMNLSLLSQKPYFERPCLKDPRGKALNTWIHIRALNSKLHFHFPGWKSVWSIRLNYFLNNIDTWHRHHML